MLEELFLNHLLRLVLLFRHRLDKATHTFRLGRSGKNTVHRHAGPGHRLRNAPRHGNLRRLGRPVVHHFRRNLDRRLAGNENEFGQVSGISATENPASGFPTIHLFFWSRKTGMIDIGSFGGSFGSANTLNDRGQVAGEALSTGDATDHAFIWSKREGIRDGTLGGSYSAATNLNDLGHVVGVSSVTSGFTHTFLWRRGEMNDLGVVPGDEYSQPFGINSRTQVVGFSNEICEGPHSHAFLWEHGIMLDLNSLVTSNPTGLHLFEAVQINERGEIVGNGITAEGDIHAFVALPCDRLHPMLDGCDYSPVNADAVMPVMPPSSLIVLQNATKHGSAAK